MKRPLNSDELGAVGESRFEDHCKTSGLIPNKSDRDRTGWDFVVEWPQTSLDEGSFDKRKVPISCLTQVKTVWAENDRVSVRLSSLERLVKSPLPCFLYVLAINDEKLSVSAYIVHIRGDFSALVLKKLRDSQVKGKLPNKTTISFSIRKWCKDIELTGGAFRDFVESQVDQPMATYTDSKEKEISKLGFPSEGGLSVKATFNAENADELFDGFLGLKPLKGKMHDAVEERFGIILPNTDFPEVEGLIEIQPQPTGRCDIAIRESAEGTPTIFNADVYTLPPPMQQAGLIKMLLKVDLFDLVLKVDLRAERVAINIQFLPNGAALQEGKFTSDNWLRFYKLVTLIANGQALMDLQLENVSQPFSGRLSADIKDEVAAEANYLVKLLRALRGGLALAGQLEKEIRLAEILELSKELLEFDAIRVDPEKLDPLSFRAEFRNDADLSGLVSEPMPILYFMLIPFDDWVLIACVEIDMEGTIDGSCIDWRGGMPKFKSVRSIPKTEDAIDHHVKKMQHESGVKSYFLNKGEVLPGSNEQR